MGHLHVRFRRRHKSPGIHALGKLGENGGHSAEMAGSLQISNQVKRSRLGVDTRIEPVSVFTTMVDVRSRRRFV